MNKVYEDIQDSAKDHYSKIIDRSLRHLENGVDVKIDNKSFNNAAEYLKHLRDDHNHPFMPSSKIEDHLESLGTDTSRNHTKQKELETSKEIEIEKSHDLSV